MTAWTRQTGTVGGVRNFVPRTLIRRAPVSGAPIEVLESVLVGVRSYQENYDPGRYLIRTYFLDPISDAPAQNVQQLRVGGLLYHDNVDCYLATGQQAAEVVRDVVYDHPGGPLPVGYDATVGTTTVAGTQIFPGGNLPLSAPVPDTGAVAIPTDGTWRMSLWPNRGQSGPPPIVRHDASNDPWKIDRVWGPYAPAANFPADGWSGRWEQWVPLIPTSDPELTNYLGRAVVDDGLRVNLDGDRLTTYRGGVAADAWIQQDPTAYTVPFAVEAGPGSAPSRNMYAWPFAATSPWNMPIGSNAQLVPAGFQATTGDGGRIGVEWESIGINPTDPVKTLTASDGGIPGGTQVRVPPTLQRLPDGGGTYSNGVAAFLDDDNTRVWLGQHLLLTAGGNPSWEWTIPWGSSESLTGNGIRGGHGGSGLSSLGGAIRVGELTGANPIRHALKVGIYADNYLSTFAGGYRWPADRADSYWNQGYYNGPVPALRMGSLLTLPPNTDLSFVTDPKARKIAEALRDYGAYVVDDSAWDFIYVEADAAVGMESAGGEWPYNNMTFHAQLQDVFELLHVVDNVSQSNWTTWAATGQGMGGGTPRQPFAPPFEGEPAAPPPGGAGPGGTHLLTIDYLKAFGPGELHWSYTLTSTPIDPPVEPGADAMKQGVFLGGGNPASSDDFAARVGVAVTMFQPSIWSWETRPVFAATGPAWLAENPDREICFTYNWLTGTQGGGSASNPGPGEWDNTQTDADATSLANHLVAQGIATKCIARLGPECNAPWFPWGSTQPGNLDGAGFKRLYRRIAAIFLASGIRTTWGVVPGAPGLNGSQTTEGADATLFWPGADVVSYIDYDIFDRSLPGTGPRLDQMRSLPQGLDWLKTFSDAQDVPFLIGETGLAATTSPNVGFGDDPQWITGFYTWCANNGCHAVIYKNVPYGGADTTLEQNPLSWQAYRAWWQAYAAANP